MPQSDSVEKIITRYFACVAREVFDYEGKEYTPKPLQVSPLLLRGYTCPASCGGCCAIKFSLDYLPSEKRPEGLIKRKVMFNHRPVRIWTDWQEDNETSRCQHLDPENGRCGIYKRRPFSCDFELIRTLEFSDRSRPNVLTQKLFGRGWNMLRIDGERGALCEMTPPTKDTIADVVRKLARLQAWADHFGVKTWIPDIVKLIEQGRLTRPHTFNPAPFKGWFKR